MEIKKESLPEIEKIVHSAHLSVAEHRKMASAMVRFSESFINLAQNECPEFAEKAKQIAALLQGVMDQENIIANAEERLAEDLNDISVRYDLLYKLGTDIQSKRNQLVSLKKKIKELERSIDYSKVSGASGKALKYQGDLAGAKQKKVETTNQLEQLLERFIDLRQKYARFKVKRLEHGYTNLGDIVAKSLEVEKHLLGQLQRDCVQARDNLDDFFEDQLEAASKLAKEHDENNKPEGEQAEVKEENPQPEAKEENPQPEVQEENPQPEVQEENPQPEVQEENPQPEVQEENPQPEVQEENPQPEVQEEEQEQNNE